MPTVTDLLADALVDTASLAEEAGDDDLAAILGLLLVAHERGDTRDLRRWMIDRIRRAVVGEGGRN